MIDVLVEIENKDSIIDNLQRWKSLLAMLNSPQYSGVSIEINKRIGEFENMDAEYLKIKKEYLSQQKQHKKLEEGTEMLRSQYHNALKNLQNINVETFDQEKSNIGNTLKCLTQEVSLLTSKNEELNRQLENRPYYTAYEEITKEIKNLKEEYENLKKMKDSKE